MPESLFKLSFRRQPATLIKKRFWQRCSPVNFVKFLRPSFFQITFGGLLPYSERSPNLFLNIHICICNNLLIQEVIESHHQSNKIKFL